MSDLYTPLFDYFLFTVDKRFETKSESGIIMISEAYVSGGENEESDEFNSHKRIYGQVVAVPRSFSDEKITAIDPGLPAPKKYIGAEFIQQMIASGARMWSKKDYSPTTYEMDFVTCADIGAKTDIRNGDKIYFNYNATELDQYVGKKDGKQVFKVRVDEILCVVRDGQIISQGGWVIIKPNKETWDDITNDAGIIIKTAPEKIPLEGFIVAANFTEGLKIGDKIIYHHDADWQLTIEGEEAFVIQEKDILALIEDEKTKAQK